MIELVSDEITTEMVEGNVLVKRVIVEKYAPIDYQTAISKFKGRIEQASEDIKETSRILDIFMERDEEVDMLRAAEVAKGRAEREEALKAELAEQDKGLDELEASVEEIENGTAD